MRPHLLLLVLALCFFALPASATVYVPADFQEMVTASTFIVYGRVVDVRSDATGDRRTVTTAVTVDVEQPLKGSPGSEITFRVPGGRVGAYERVVVGAPRFEPGDEVVLFLTSRGPSVPYIFGLSQGAYRISRATGRALVLPLPVLAGNRDGAATGRLVRGDPARRPLPLEDFAREVKAALQKAAMERAR